MSIKRCKAYCGVRCIDGGCPIANRDDYIERGYDVVSSCDECGSYKGCEDCAFDGTKYCIKNIGGELSNETLA